MRSTRLTALCLALLAALMLVAAGCGSSSKNSAATTEATTTEAATTEDAAEMTDLANEVPIVRFVNLVLFQAIKDRASDIHFEPFENEFKIRYRVDGALYEMSPPPRHLALPVISRVMTGISPCACLK